MRISSISGGAISHCRSRQVSLQVRHLADTVKSASEAALREVIGRRHIDEALTVGKLEIQEETKALLQAILSTYEAGLQIIAVQLQEVQPPKQVIDAFKDVASAREDKAASSMRRRATGAPSSGGPRQVEASPARGRSLS